MGCLSGLKFWRKKSAAEATETNPAPRPYNPNLNGGRLQHSPQPPPYQTPPPQAYDEKARYPLHNSSYAASGVKPQQPQLQTPSPYFRQGYAANVSSPQDPIGAGIKEKDEGVSDPEVERRRKAAEAARLKAEREEQERLDFFQMM